ncbi:hypothetical protein ERJ75_000849400 [Trypanosoma vivax]|nr:hypothetical protein TRVL_09991 [Trypanosoma vivax]KAH8612824.1 hypothetical protein ERJ75_000849400 [Trypanosoma vivax]
MLASSSTLSLATTSRTSNVPDETLCEWWRGKLEVWCHAAVLITSLLQKHNSLTRECKRFTGRVRNVGGVAQHSAMDKGWNEIRTKYWEGFLLTSEGSREANAIVADVLS